MKSTVTCLFVALALAGCGTSSPTWKNSSSDSAQNVNDTAACRQNALSATGNAPVNADTKQRERDIFENCMLAKGYRK